jgi:flagellar protein FliL
MSSEAKKDPKAAAEAAPKEAAAADAAPADGGKKKKLMIMIIGGVVLLGGGAGAFFFLKGGGEAEHGEPAKDGHGAPAADEHGAPPADHGKPAEGGHGEKAEKKDGHGAPAGGEHGDKKAGADDHGAAPGSEKDGQIGDFGETFVLKPFHLNLGNPLENHYIRIEVTFEFKGGAEQKAEIEKRMPQLRDAVINIASRKSKEFLLGPDGKDQLRHEVLVRVNQYMSKPIESVYITDLLIE